MKIEFAEIPEPGLALLLDGQRFDLTAVEPHVTIDGRETTLLAWAGHCADCGAAFVTKSPANRVAESRRCELHRKPGIKAHSK